MKHAIVRTPGRSLIRGLTTSNLGLPNLEDALGQHQKYVDALARCGIEVTVLSAEENFPDAVFVEDTAVLTEQCAVITHLGAPTRRGEQTSVQEALRKFYRRIECIEPPGTLEGGDVMKVQDHFYVGLSARTNTEGVRQFEAILSQYGYKIHRVPVGNSLHLKSGVAYLENNNLLVTEEFAELEIFKRFNRIIIDREEGYAANCIWINDRVLAPAGYPKTKDALSRAGYEVLTLDTSEFKKLDGGLSCMSLRF